MPRVDKGRGRERPEKGEIENWTHIERERNRESATAGGNESPCTGGGGWLELGAIDE